MRISDWSSDVCSSDLRLFDLPATAIGTGDLPLLGLPVVSRTVLEPSLEDVVLGAAKIEHDHRNFRPLRRCYDRILAIDGIMNGRSEEHTSELQSLMRISYAVFCLKKKKNNKKTNTDTDADTNNIHHMQTNTYKHKYSNTISTTHNTRDTQTTTRTP